MKTIGRLAALALAAAALAACGGANDNQQQPAAGGDTGFAAPATVPTVNNPDAPDSTAGVAPVGSGQPPGVAGDTMSSQRPGGAKPPQPVGTPRRP